MLSCCVGNREADVAALKTWYEGKHRGYKIAPVSQPPVQDPWEVLKTQTPQSSYEAVYQWLGGELLDSGFVFSIYWQEADAKGYSIGFGDFLRDIFPWY
jgi:hypothetical protein